ncbi:hypothetical protein L4X63_06190 [Geomonas sp. Red32]|uniref:hypothetical protein n=1 Tax=Geomonas sp. Red32 TaxID=2912856 RepID=UPI00202CEA4E|nr:hypothetical protein [Geomonas sp. Red32]MCM0081176.1 hypothetical protein [Geomonas sp. Red32]
MSIATIQAETVAPQPPGQADSFPVPQDSPRDTTTTSTTANDQVQITGRLGTALQQLQDKNDQQNGLADAIRSSHRAAASLRQKLDSAKAPLQTIVKNFPPFAPEDKERMKLLMSYSSLRKEIDELTFPPPPDVVQAHKVPAVPATLPQGATDSQINDHLAKLDAASAAVGDFQSSLAAGTASLVTNSGSTSLFSGPSGATAGATAAPLADSSAWQLSAEVGRQFASSVAQGVTVDGHLQFLKGLG